MRIDNPEDYILSGFEKSNTKNKKYDAILRDKEGKIKRVPFGDIRYEHFRDSTPNKLYSHLDHNDNNRREAFRKRHKNNSKYKYSSAYFSYNYLW
jgi:hypothetical protein